MTLRIETAEVAELFNAARQLLLNSSYSAFLAPSLDRVRTALAAFEEADATAYAVAAVKEKYPPAPAPVVEPPVVEAPAAVTPPAKPTRKKTAKKAPAKPVKKAAKQVKKTVKKPVKKATKK